VANESAADVGIVAPVVQNRLCALCGDRAGRGDVVGIGAEEGGSNWTARIVSDRGTHRADHSAVAGAVRLGGVRL